MNCPDCGNPVEHGAQFCPKCFAHIKPPTIWQRLLALFQSATKPRRPFINIKKTVTIRTRDKHGEQHEYHSLTDVPPELRAEIEKAESELKQQFSVTSSDGPTTKIVSRKVASVFKFRGNSGREQVYHSLDEMPPEVRAIFDRAQNQRKASDNT